MNVLQQNFQVNFRYAVYFTEHLFSLKNRDFLYMLERMTGEGFTQKLLFVIDEQVHMLHPTLTDQIDKYFREAKHMQVVEEKLIIVGGEIAKNNTVYFDRIIAAINHYKIDRHSYVVAIGGGSILDLVGYAAAVAHRGIKHIRIPTTVLSQDDSGVGVKNGINSFGKKNFLGTFASPVAVFNDYHFLTTLNNRHWIAGISEAIKVALIKDYLFFEWLEEAADKILLRNKGVMKYLIKQCARLHLEHIASGDPFELGSSRPLDFGHWSAHKLEQMSEFQLLHGEAVAIGIALDSVYSFLQGYFSQKECVRVLQLLQRYQLPIFNEILLNSENVTALLDGLEEFREHLGGQLTVMLLGAIGQGCEVHEMDPIKIKEALSILESAFLTQRSLELVLVDFLSF